jgi:hypothetical protein
MNKSKIGALNNSFTGNFSEVKIVFCPDNLILCMLYLQQVSPLSNGKELMRLVQQTIICHDIN